jgi:hypothetical protein
MLSAALAAYFLAGPVFLTIPHRAAAWLGMR